MRLSRYEDLLQYVADANVPRRENHDERSVEVPVQLPPLDGTVYMRWEKSLPYVQVIHPFIFDVPEGRVGEVETAITRANETLVAPGLSFHHDKRFIYMRRCVPVYQEGIAATAFQKEVTYVLDVAREFLGPLAAIVAGTPGDQILTIVGKSGSSPRA